MTDPTLCRLDSALAALVFVLAGGLSSPAAIGQAPLGIEREMVPVDAGSIVGVADFDGDGDLDLLTAWTGVYLNDGNARFSAHPILSAVTSFTAIAVADFNGDGLPDVIGGTGLVGLAAWVSVGGGILVEASGILPLLPAGASITCLAPGDVDGDGDQDLVIGRCGAPLVLWLNVGLLLFVDGSAQFPAGALCPRQMELLDTDGDGDRDLLMTNNSGAVLVASQNRILMPNTGAGFFGPSAGMLGTGLPWEFFVTGDVNGDQLPDVAFFTSSAITIAVNAGAGQAFATASLSTYGAWGLPVLVDVNGDGADELVVTSLFAGVNTHPVGPGPVILPPLQTLDLFSNVRPVAGDFDGDGDRDLVVAAIQAHRVLLNTGQGLTAIKGYFTSASTGEMVAGDVEGDGDMDLVGPLIGIARNDGNGQLDWDATMTCTGACPVHTSNVVIHPFDADGDGDLDVYVANGSNGTMPPGDRLLMNTGAGFTATIAYLPGSTYVLTIESGDLDGDGDLDLVVVRFAVNGSAMPVQVFFNGGAGVFGPPVSLQAAIWTADVGLVDVDGDGDLDLVAGSVAPSTSTLFMNDGAGAFTQASSFPGMPASHIMAGDVDGDGDADLILDNQVLINAGNGIFAAGANLGFAVAPNYRPALVDADDDGDLDVFHSGWLYMNTGGAAFVPMFAIANQTQWAVVADFDRDGDDDLVIPTPSPRLYSGLARQLVRGNPARPGRPASFDLCGPALGTWTLFASSGPASVPLPPHGTVWIDPGNAWVLGSGGFDAAGRGSYSTVVPTSPSFVGQSYFLQAIVFGGPQPKLTGREIATIATY